MPIDQKIWNISESAPSELKISSLKTELELEDIIEKSPGIINDNILIIGRQVRTDFGGIIDLLAIDNAGAIIIIELKKSKTPRDVISQTIDYASWIIQLEPSKISEIYTNYAEKRMIESSLFKAFQSHFGKEITEDEINQYHQMIIVATEVDNSSERIIKYLSNSEIPINIIFFRIFNQGNNQLLSRIWFLDPQETADNSSLPKEKVPWNGEYYHSFGIGEVRNLGDATKYGFISAGGGSWYSKTMSMLSPGNRVWVNVPSIGYVGVCEVLERAGMAKDIRFKDFDNKNIFELETQGTYLAGFKDDEEKAEYIVPVRWIKSVNISSAIKEIGFFGNQNSICRPTAQRWLKTIEILKKVWIIN